MTNKIYFVSTSEYKGKTYAKRLKEIGWQLERINLEMPEGRELNCREIAKQKIDYAKKKVTKRPFFVEDRGFELEALNGFPKTHVKDLIDIIKIKTILPLIKTKNGAKFTYAVGFIDIKNNVKIFYGEEKGIVKADSRNPKSLKDIFHYYKIQGIPLSKLTGEKLKLYQKFWTKDDAMAKLINYLKKLS